MKSSAEAATRGGQTCSIQGNHMVPLKPATTTTTKRSVSVILEEGKCEKRFTHDFHAGDAFAHRFDLKKQAAVICVNPTRFRSKACALSPRLRAQG